MRQRLHESAKCKAQRFTEAETEKAFSLMKMGFFLKKIFANAVS